MSDKPKVDISNDLLFKLSVGTIWFSGVMYLLVGVGMGALFTLPALADPEMPAWFSTAMGGLVFVVSVACAVGNFLVASALGKRKSWAWVGAVVIGGLYAPSGCLPLGVLILVAMLRPGVREAYLGEG